VWVDMFKVWIRGRLHAKLKTPGANDGSVSVLMVTTCAVLIALIVFYRTIITGEWRNAVANEEDCWYFVIFYFNPSGA